MPHAMSIIDGGWAGCFWDMALCQGLAVLSKVLKEKLLHSKIKAAFTIQIQCF